MKTNSWKYFWMSWMRYWEKQNGEPDWNSGVSHQNLSKSLSQDLLGWKILDQLATWTPLCNSCLWYLTLNESSSIVKPLKMLYLRLNYCFLNWYIHRESLYKLRVSFILLKTMMETFSILMSKKTQMSF